MVTTQETELEWERIQRRLNVKNKVISDVFRTLFHIHDGAFLIKLYFCPLTISAKNFIIDV